MNFPEGGGDIVRTSAVSGYAFDPEATHAMGIAFDGACWTLGLEDRSAAVATKVALAVLEQAAGGQRDPHSLRRQVLVAFAH
jgi:hypothetical protein